MRRIPRRIAGTAIALVCGASVAHLLGAGPFGGVEASAEDAPFGRLAFWESVPITRGAAPAGLETMAAYEP